MQLKTAKPTVFLATSFPKEARYFYGQILGLPLLLEDDYALVFDIAGLELRISKIPSHKPLPYTVLDWEVEDIVRASDMLASRNVEFVIFENMGQDERGIWTATDRTARILWFKDPDGNLLSVSERR